MFTRMHIFSSHNFDVVVIAGLLKGPTHKPHLDAKTWKDPASIETGGK